MAKCSADLVFPESDAVWPFQAGSHLVEVEPFGKPEQSKNQHTDTCTHAHMSARTHARMHARAHTHTYRANKLKHKIFFLIQIQH